MLRLLGSGWLLVVRKWDGDDGNRRHGVWFYTLDGKVARSRLPVIAQMVDLEMIAKKRGFGGDCVQYELTAAGAQRAEKLK